MAQRLRDWYSGGEQGLLTVCNTEGAPQAVQDAVRRWFAEGRKRLDAIAHDIENIERPGDE